MNLSPRGVAVRALSLAVVSAVCVHAQHVYTWAELREKLVASNPSLQAAKLAVDESKADEITAYLRPNPSLTTTLDQLNPFTASPYQPLANTLPSVSLSYLHERQRKRELRRDSAREATSIALSNYADQERALVFALRGAYVRTLQAMAVEKMARENLAYWDRVIQLSADRLKAGDIAQIDLDRIELQRVQFASDVETAVVNLRTAKIQLLQLMNDRTPIDEFRVDGSYDFAPTLTTLDELRDAALTARPDLRAALQATQKAAIDHKLAVANGSADPTVSFDVGRNPPIPAYFGVSVNIPLRIFDRNQGEKLRTEIETRRERALAEAQRATVLGDVDSAYHTVASAIALLKPYKERYLAQAERVRETVAFSYARGGAALVDFLNAQNEYRSVRLNYLNLVGAYLTAAGQLNWAVGREVIP